MPKNKRTSFFQTHWFTLVNLVLVIFILLLPYYLFDGRLFLGGDDTRFYLAYPFEFLKSLTFYSWNNISSLPYFIPNHQWIPLVASLSVVERLVGSKIILEYLSFSTLLILGFVYFQKFIRELIGEEYLISIISSLIYIFCPITLIGLMYSLAPVWLLTLVPIVGYYFVRYLKRGYIYDLVAVTVWSILFSFIYYSIAWIVALMLPLIFASIFYSFVVENPIPKFAKKMIIFVFFIISSQLFWLVSFVASLTSGGSTGLSQKVASISVADTFRNIIVSTATDNIIYPLLTFYHRQIAMDFVWHLKDVFINYYDRVLPLSIIFLIVLFLGIIRFNKVLSVEKQKLFIFLFAAFLIVLYFSTVNIGFLKYIFLILGYVPGFAILRNFTDKFAFAFVFIYTTLFSFCLFVIKQNYKFYKLIFVLVMFVTFINFVPAKQIIASPLWKTNDVYTTVNLPTEYIDFTKEATLKIHSDTNIIVFPQNYTAYSIIGEDNGQHAYVGTSPFKFLTGLNDLTGTDSYYPSISSKIQDLITKRDYKKLLSLLTTINTGYVMTEKNIPSEVINSYLFDTNYLKFQDKTLIKSIAAEEVLKSNKGNYIIYKLRNSTTVISSEAQVSYKKINPVTYKISIAHLKGDEKVFFHETFHPGWTLYADGKSVFANTHREFRPYGNQWTINSDFIKKNFNKALYRENPDGSIDINLTLYFSPQNYFYVGIFLTIIFLCVGLWFVNVIKKNEKKKRKK